MLELIHIKNFALIEDIQLELDKGFNVMTGETGAGKSIIIGALNSILGERVASENIRSGADKAVIEAVFDISRAHDVKGSLAESGISIDEDQLVVKREITADGKNRIFMNNSIVTLAKLKEIGNSLVDIHGQYEHQYLLQVDNHYRILDKFGRLESDVEAYSVFYSDYTDLLRRKEKLMMNESEKERMAEILRFAIREIDEAAIKPGEDQELEEIVTKLTHSGKLFENIDSLYGMIYDNEQAILGSLKKGIGELDKVLDFDRDLVDIKNRLDTVRFELEDISNFLRSYRQKNAYNPSDLDSLIGRLELINKLKKKYGGSVAGVGEYRKQAGQDLDAIEHNEEELQKIDKAIADAREKVRAAAMNLSGRRHVIAKLLEEKVNIELRELAMKGANFGVRFSMIESEDGIVTVDGRKIKAGRNGIDEIEFLISTNIGEEAKPLRKIISGGELSRIMLALKSIFAEADRVDTMVFDEIDTGISGETALVVGAKMKTLAKTKQILCITHLPQIAARSGRHFTVSKEVAGGKTQTTVRVLNEKEKVQEIARIMKGDKITEATLEHARELINT
jgi:DNA repair protein RecN (Recombination protein N)